MLGTAHQRWPGILVGGCQASREKPGLRRYLNVGLFLASHAVRARGREEAATALLASTVTAVLSPDGTADAVEQTREEETYASGPHEGEGLDAHVGSLAVALESIAALDKNGANRVS